MLTRTRQFGLTKSIANGDKPKVYTFRANDGEFDRYQDRNSVKGWDTKAFNANPVILLNHDDGSGGFFGTGRKDVLPIGKGRAYVEGEALMVDVEFDQKDELAKRVEQKVADGYMNAVSVRYLLKEGKFKSNDMGGIDSEEQELLEISLVNIPGNQRAVRVKELAEAEAAFIDRIAEAVAKKLAPAPAPEPKKDSPPDFEALAKRVQEHLKEKSG
jgi:phage head maturation protease